MVQWREFEKLREEKEALLAVVLELEARVALLSLRESAARDVITEARRWAVKMRVEGDESRAGDETG